MAWRCQNAIACGIRTAAPVSVQTGPFAASAVIRRRASSACIGGKNKRAAAPVDTSTTAGMTAACAALDAVRQREYARLAGRARRFIKRQKYTLLARREHYTYQGRQALKLWHQANRRGPTA